MALPDRKAQPPDKKALAKAIEDLLLASGAELDAETRETPGRVAKAFCEDLLDGYARDPVETLRRSRAPCGGTAASPWRRGPASSRRTPSCAIRWRGARTADEGARHRRFARHRPGGRRRADRGRNAGGGVRFPIGSRGARRNAGEAMRRLRRGAGPVTVRGGGSLRLRGAQCRRARARADRELQRRAVGPRPGREPA